MQRYSNNTSRSVAFLKDAITRRLDDFFQKGTPGAFSFPALEIEADETPLHHFLVK
jgi:hypothetical protein